MMEEGAASPLELSSVKSEDKLASSVTVPLQHAVAAAAPAKTMKGEAPPAVASAAPVKGDAPPAVAAAVSVKGEWAPPAVKGEASATDEQVERAIAALARDASIAVAQEVEGRWRCFQRSMAREALKLSPCTPGTPLSLSRLHAPFLAFFSRSLAVLCLLACDGRSGMKALCTCF
jgi:hypothetical protein